MSAGANSSSSGSAATAADACPPPTLLPLPAAVVGTAPAAASTSSASALEEWGRSEAGRCDDGDPDLEFCELPGIINTPPAERSAAEEAWSRGRWLLGLLVLQSMSSFVLDGYQELLKEHLVVTLFLTMLVGAGGNAGNQSAIKVIRGLATGSMKPSADGIRCAMQQQLAVGLMLGVGLAAGGWLRVWLTNGDAMNATAIAISLFLIVLCSVIAGTGELGGKDWQCRRRSVAAHTQTRIAFVADLKCLFLTTTGTQRSAIPALATLSVPRRRCRAAVCAGAGGHRPSQCRHQHPSCDGCFGGADHLRNLPPGAGPAGSGAQGGGGGLSSTQPVV